MIRETQTAIEIRDDEADGSAATKTVIEGNEKPGLVVNVNTQTNVAAITPGYVIRLPASRAEGAPMIEGNVSP